MLDGIDRQRVRNQILPRPLVATSADRPNGSQIRHSSRQAHLVYFDWQQHWSSVKVLFERTDVRWAACQHVSGWHTCHFCAEQHGSAFTWPPADSPRGPPKVFPLLLEHDDCDLGGDACQSAELAFSIMPDAKAQELIQRQRAELSSVAKDDDSEAVFEIVRKYQLECKDWLATELDDARLLSTGLSGIHTRLLPLTFRLAQLLAPWGAVLEVFWQGLEPRSLSPPPKGQRSCFRRGTRRKASCYTAPNGRDAGKTGKRVTAARDRRIVDERSGRGRDERGRVHSLSRILHEVVSACRGARRGQTARAPLVQGWWHPSLPVCVAALSTGAAA